MSTTTAFPGPLIIGTFEKRAPGQLPITLMAFGNLYATNFDTNPKTRVHYVML